MPMDQSLDITQALKDTENALRDFVATVLQKKLGADWIVKCGVTPERRQKWMERKEDEAKRQTSGTVDERLLYYADFYDLKTILKKHWQEFSDALGEWHRLEVWLSELEKLRDPDAHRRELLPHQKHMALGIEGDIRTRLVRYRSKLETLEDYFPRIECVRDNYGTVYTAGSDGMVSAGATLRPGDRLEFVVTARDPLDAPLEYRFCTFRIGGFDSDWISQNSYSYVVSKSDVGRMFIVIIKIRSPREFHASATDDDSVFIRYRVLPPRETYED